MLSINPWNILWTVVNLLVIYAIFRKFLFQPVMNVINAREKMINNQFKSAKDAEDEADKLKKEYHDKIKTAKTEADQILADAKERADEAYNSQMEDIRVETERLKEKAKKDKRTFRPQKSSTFSSGHYPIRTRLQQLYL